MATNPNDKSNLIITSEINNNDNKKQVKKPSSKIEVVDEKDYNRITKNDTDLTLLPDSKIQVLKAESFNFNPGSFKLVDPKAKLYIKNFSTEAKNALHTAFQDENFQKAVAYCATQKLGGKGKSARMQYESQIDAYLRGVKLYHDSLKTSYKGLLKYAPHHVMQLWLANKPEDKIYDGVRKYANGMETQFKYADLQALGLNEKEIALCYAKLVKNLEILVNNPKGTDPWKKLVARYVNFERGYLTGAKRDDKGVATLLLQVKALDINTGGKIDVASLLESAQSQ